MANAKVCDRCGNIVKNGGDFLSMRRFKLPRFFGVITGKKRDDLWTELVGSLDLCESCTQEFFNFVRRPGWKRKLNEPATGMKTS